MAAIRSRSARQQPATPPSPQGDGLSPKQRRALDASRQVARLMDARWGVGPFRFGLDSLVGLVPGVGDALPLLATAFQLRVAHRLGLPPSALLRIALNGGLDAAVGVVPLVGDVVDLFFKASLRNQQIIEDELARRGQGAPPR